MIADFGMRDWQVNCTDPDLNCMLKSYSSFLAVERE